MSVRIRLRRMGATKRPSYRIVVAESTAARTGRVLETIGHYDPLVEPHTLVVKADRAQHWMSNGALPTEAAADLLRKAGVLAAEAPAAESAGRTDQ
jgi:small subunit ribosomal protein S16